MNECPLPVNTMQPISLTDLASTASLLTRKDRKYLVPIAVAEQLVTQDGLEVLEIDGRRTFHYESVYFDTPDRVSYRAAAHKRRRRFKVRTRSYLDSGLCSLEVKTRERRGLTEKHRLPYAIARRAHLTDEALEFIEGFDTIVPHSRHLQPVLTTRYERTTLLETESSSRITIDTNLQCQTPDGSSVSLPEMAVVETKTSGSPCAIDHLLWRLRQRPIKLSKFGAGLAALTPGLPANKWNRVLRTYFGWTPAPTGIDARGGRPGPVGIVDGSLADSCTSGHNRMPFVPLLEGATS